MEGRIKLGGKLVINRKGINLEVRCPFNKNENMGGNHFCGEWCALFGEPKPHYESECYDTGDGIIEERRKTGKTVLRLCKARLIFDKFTDDREE